MSCILVCSACLSNKWIIQRRADGSQEKSCGAWFGACRRGGNPFDDTQPLARGRWMDFNEWLKAYQEMWPLDVEGPC
jgi:hypothetical protein